MMYRYFTNGYYGRNCLETGYLGSGWGILFGVGILLLIALLIYIIVHNKNKKIYSDAASENLKLRYVKGEISEEEYLRKKDLISK